MEIRFDVNDRGVRERFFERQLAEAIAPLGPGDLPRWGAMTPQHMIEHLQWAFACSTGGLVVPCTTPPQLLDRAKRFLHDNRPTPREYRNPLLGEIPPPFRYPDLAASEGALEEEIRKFLSHFVEEPEAVHTHPLFGPLGAEEWHRAHFKHSYHHLLQFGLVAEPPG